MARHNCGHESKTPTPTSVKAWCSTALDIDEVLSGFSDDDVHVFVADVVKSFDTVNGGS